VRLIDALIADRVSGLLDEHGVTRTQWQLLLALSRGPASTEQLDKTLAPFLAEGDSETSRDHLAELGESGWVKMEDGENSLTDRGRTAFTRLSDVVAECRETVPAGVTDDDLGTTVSVLERMARDLGWADEAEYE
jgi:DNA-binding MarR family transcriptional regulator